MNWTPYIDYNVTDELIISGHENDEPINLKLLLVNLFRQVLNKSTHTF